MTQTGNTAIQQAVCNSLQKANNELQAQAMRNDASWSPGEQTQVKRKDYKYSTQTFRDTKDNVQDNA